MVAIEHVPGGPSLGAERRFRIAAAAIGALVAAYAIATAAGAPSSVLSAAFNVQVSVVPVVAWWAYRRSPSEQRRLWLLLALAATLWLAGTLVWVREWWALGEHVPTPPGPWDALFIGAYCAAFAAVATGMRESVHLRHALLDTVMLVSAAVAVGSIVLRGRLTFGIGVETAVIAARPALGVAIITLLASAAFGSWVGITRATALVGAGQGALMSGSIVFSISALQGQFTDDRWTNVLWGLGAGLSALGGLAVILGVDQPIAREHPPLVRATAGATASLALSVVAITATLGLAFTHDDPQTTRVALASVGSLAAAATVRAYLAVRSARDLAEAMNEHALRHQRESEGLSRRLAEAEARREHAEGELVALHVVHDSFQRVLEIRDQETEGRVRESLDSPAWDLLTLERDPERERRPE